MSIAIVSVVYNRTDSLARQLRSLEHAVYPEPVTLVISIDKSQTTAVEDFANSYTWPHGEKRVITHDHNLGTRRHMLSLGALFSDFDALIILEDDITVAPAFYIFAKACVAAYGDDPLVAGISLYHFPINY
jgi:GT2 family glycosyltransferase